MITGLLGTKSKMSQTFTRSGQRVSVSVVKVEPNMVTFIKTQDRDGYRAVQLGIVSKKIKNTKKPVLGHLKKAAKDIKKASKYLREIKIKDTDTEMKIGELIKASDVVRPGDLVKVTGVSKGKGFAGGVKRWGFAGGPKTHGQSDRLRAPGSIGQTTTPGRVFKGKKMAGHMGVGKLTVTGLEVVNIDPAKNLLEVKGSVPGSRNGFLIIEKTGKLKSYTSAPPPKEKEEETKAKERK